MNAANREQICRIHVPVLNRPRRSLQKYCEGLEDLGLMLPNLKQFTMSPMSSADVDGSDPERLMVERVRAVLEATQQYFPDLEYEVEGFDETVSVSERAKLVILGLDIE